MKRVPPEALIETQRFANAKTSTAGAELEVPLLHPPNGVASRQNARARARQQDITADYHVTTARINTFR